MNGKPSITKCVIKIYNKRDYNKIYNKTDYWWKRANLMKWIEFTNLLLRYECVVKNISSLKQE